MNIKLCGFDFKDGALLHNRPGVYVILSSVSKECQVVDVGESKDIKSRVDNHDRKDCWKKSCVGALSVAVLYTPHLPQEGRLQIIAKIKREYNPPCGLTTDVEKTEGGKGHEVGVR